MRARRGSGSPRRYELFNEQLLEYEGMHGIRSACHLLVYGCGADPLVCVVGNFDGGLGSPTTNAIEAVATAIAPLISRDAFRLLEWYPHSGRRFSEVTLTPVAPERIARGKVMSATHSTFGPEGLKSRSTRSVAGVIPGIRIVVFHRFLGLTPAIPAAFINRATRFSPTRMSCSSRSSAWILGEP